MRPTTDRHIAITGGIGSGKSYVCRILAGRGIEVYDCDAAAKRLMRTDRHLAEALCSLIGQDLYQDGILQKPKLAKYLLASEENKQAVNNIIHPAVARDFMSSGYEWLESAILFDSGFYRRIMFDKIVCVTAPLDVRISRVMQRDNITRDKALEWINRQWPQDQVIKHSDYVIDNDNGADLNGQITQLLNKIQS